MSVAAGYAAILGWFAYHPDNVPDSVALVLLLVTPLIAGLVAGPWAALALPAAVLVSVPAGYGTGEAEIPVWFGMMFAGLIALPVIAVASMVR
jgi:hypothetical protein